MTQGEQVPFEQAVTVVDVCPPEKTEPLGGELGGSIATKVAFGCAFTLTDTPSQRMLVALFAPVRVTVTSVPEFAMVQTTG